MATPEGKVKDGVKKLLKQYGAYWHMPVQTGYGAPALDFHACHRGYYLGIETKAAGKKLTKRQAFIADEIRNAGGEVLVVNGDDYVALEQWLNEKENE